MSEHIYAKKIKGKVYYYLQRTFREKLEPTENGKTRGSGKSRVRTQSIYLGTAESILERLKQPTKPVEIRHREFGFVAAIYHTAQEIGLVDLLRNHITGSRYGVARWIYFFLPIVNRLQHATSKEQMGDWAALTVLPELVGFSAERLSSQSFWYATDDVISEKELRQKRSEKRDSSEDLFAGISDKIFCTIEEELFSKVREGVGLSGDTLIYDTTNFFTYIEEPARSRLARTGHNKDMQHHRKQVGLAMCVDKEWGIPLFHRLYRGNSQDAKTFAGLVDELLDQMRTGFGQIDKLILVLDKGNNSQKNFEALQGKVKWVGSLVPSHFPDLLKLSLESYEGKWEEYSYHRLRREVMGINCALVLTYSAKLARKQEYSLEQGIAKLKRQLQEKWAQYKKRPKEIPAGISRPLKESHYGKYIKVLCQNGELIFEETEATAEKRKRFGKNLLFSNDLNAESGWVITQYHAKNRIEDNFKVLKDPELIRWRPARHWTDTKIRAFGFCCIMSLVLIRIMELKTAQAGLRMSPAVLKQELSDIRQMILIYDQNRAIRQVSSRSLVQQKLWDLFGLEEVDRALAGG